MTELPMFAKPPKHLLHASPSRRGGVLRVPMLAGLLVVPGAAFAVCPTLTASSYTAAINDGGSTCVFTADPITITVSGSSHPVSVGGQMTFNGALTLTDNTTASNTRGVYVTSSGSVTFEKDVSLVKNIGGFPNAAVLEMDTSGVLTFKGNAALSSNVRAAASGFATRDTLRVNKGTVIADQDLNIVSQGGTRTALYTAGASNTTVSGNMFLDFQSPYSTYNLPIAAALWSQGGTVTVAGTSTIQTAIASGSTPGVVVNNATVKLNGLTSVTTLGANSAAVDVRIGGNAQLAQSGNIITASGTSGTGVQIRDDGSFSSGTGLTVKAQGKSFNLLSATGSTTLDAVTATTAPVVWNADATSRFTYTGTGGNYKGSSLLASGGQLTLNLSNSALWEATAASSMTLLNLQSNAILDASLVSTLAVTGKLNNAGGVVSLARTDVSPTNRLNLTGLYTANGGTLELNTVLNDASTSVSDVLQVSSTALDSGPTLISVVPDAASAPAHTSGKGILVVQVTGGASSSAAGAFALPGGYLDASGIRYELVRDAGDGNWYLRTLPTGLLTVSKVVTGPAGAPAFSGSIPFTLECTNPAITLNGTIAVTANQGNSTPITIQQDAVCNVTEGKLPDAPIGYQWTTTSYQQPGAPMVANGTQTATITNAMDKTPDPRILTGKLRVTKSVTGPANAPAFSGSIAFSVDCVNPTASLGGTIPVVANQGVSPDIEVPGGATCTVTEKLPAAPAGYKWDAPAYTQPGVIPENVTGTANITNNLIKSDDAGALQPVPTLGQWALMGLSMVLAMLGAGQLRRRQV